MAALEARVRRTYNTNTHTCIVRSARKTMILRAVPRASSAERAQISYWPRNSLIAPVIEFVVLSTCASRTHASHRVETVRDMCVLALASGWGVFECEMSHLVSGPGPAEPSVCSHWLRIDVGVAPKNYLRSPSNGHT